MVADSRQQQEQHDDGKQQAKKAIHHHPPLTTLLHPHLYNILHLSTDHGLPVPTWTATTPEEKRSLSSDKTITPSSSLRTPKASLTIGRSSEEHSRSPLSKQRTLVPEDFASSNHSQPSPNSVLEDGPYIMSASPTTEKPPSEVSSRSSMEGSPRPFGSKKRDTIDPFQKKKEEQSRPPQSENEVWVQISDAVKVVADGLRDESLREPMGSDSLVLHIITLLSLSITHKPAPSSKAPRGNVPQIDANENGTPSRDPIRHRKNLSTDSALAEKASLLNGIRLAQIQCLRALANLCIDCAVNRSHLLSHDVPLFILCLVKDTLAQTTEDDSPFDEETLTLLKTAMGALLNLQLDHEDSRRWLLKLPKPRLHFDRAESRDDVDEEDSLSAQSQDIVKATQEHQSAHTESSPFLMQESETVTILVDVMTDPRVYCPATALQSVNGSQQSKDGANGSSAGYLRWAGSWATLRLGADVASWAARIADDLINFENEELRALQRDAGLSESSNLPASPTKASLARQDGAWTKLMRPLLAFLPSQEAGHSTPDGESPDDLSPFLDADLSTISLCSELLEGCVHIGAGKDPAASVFRQRGLSSMDGLLDFIEFGQSPLGQDAFPSASMLERYELEEEDALSLAKEVSKAKANAVQAVVALASENQNLDPLFGDDGQTAFLQRMRTWLETDPKEREDLIACALLSIANLARSDQNCTALVESTDVVPKLLKLLEDGTSMTVSHATLGLLKNLCIPAPMKVSIGDSNVFELLPKFLAKDKDQAQPIQFAAVGVAKHLAYSSTGALQHNAAAICGVSGQKQKPSTFEALLDLIERTEDVPTRLESTRVIVNVVRSLCASGNSMKLEGKSVPKEELKSARRALASGRVVSALAEMLRRGAKFPVLINESIVGLVLLATQPDPQLKATIIDCLLGHDSSPRTESSATATQADESKGDSSSSSLLNGRSVPERSMTGDSMASAYSSATVTSPASCPADTLYDVLWRDDGRLPMQFAENGCTLVTALVSGGSENGDGEGKGSSEVSEDAQHLAIKMLPALRGLKVRSASSEQTQKVVKKALDVCEAAV